MSIANELSSDVAEAVLARRQEGSTQSARDLALVLKEVHSTLRQLTAESRRLKARPRGAVEEGAALAIATSE